MQELYAPKPYWVIKVLAFKQKICTIIKMLKAINFLFAQF